MKRSNRPAILVFTAVTNLADGVLKVLLPLMGARLSSSPMAISTLSVVLMLPTLLLSFHIGVLVDRRDRRSLLMASNVVRIGAMAVLLAYALSGSATLPALYALGFVLGIADVVAATAISALIPSVLPVSEWESANAWVAGIETVAQEFCGPVVGGLLLAAGTSVAVGTTGSAYVFAALTVLFLAGTVRSQNSGTAGDSEGAQPRVRRQIAEGLQFLWNERTLRLTSVVLTVLCASWGAWLALMPYLAVRELGLDPQEYGVLLSMLGGGGLAAAGSVSWLNRRVGRRWVMFGDLVGTLVMMAAPFLTDQVWVIGAAAFVGGFGGILWNVNARTISQYLVPAEMRGRFSASARVFSLGAVPVGAAVAGGLAELVGPAVALALFAPPIALLFVPFLRTLTPKVLDEIFTPVRADPH